MFNKKRNCLLLAIHFARQFVSSSVKSRDRTIAIMQKSLTQKFVRNNECLIRLEKSWIRHAIVISRIMIKFVSTKVPTPTELVVAYQTLIADTMQRRIRSRDSYHGVRTSLSRTPIKLPYVHTFSISHFPSYAICTLRDGVSMKR